MYCLHYTGNAGKGKAGNGKIQIFSYLLQASFQIYGLSSRNQRHLFRMPQKRYMKAA